MSGKYILTWHAVVIEKYGNNWLWIVCKLPIKMYCEFTIKEQTSGMKNQWIKLDA